MQLHTLKPKHIRKSQKRVGRGGKRGTTSGHGTKGQKGRAGASVKPGFRGGDKRIWELFPKLRGATSKPGNASPHRKHKFYRVRNAKAVVLNLNQLNAFGEGQVITKELLFEKGLIYDVRQLVKVLSDGTLQRKVTLENIPVSKIAKEKIEKAGGSVITK